MCEDPTPGATARLAVRLGDDSAEEPVRAALAAHGTVEGSTRFGTLHARVPEPAVADLLATLETEGVDAVETRTRVSEETGAEE